MMKLAKREKYYVGIAVCSIVLFLLFQLLIFPFFEKRERLKNGVKAKEAALKEIMGLSAEYRAYKGDSLEIQQRFARRNLNLFVLDFPQAIELPEEVVKRNMEFQTKFGVQGYPTFVVVNDDLETIDRWYGYDTPGDFIAQLDKSSADMTTIASESSTAS